MSVDLDKPSSPSSMISTDFVLLFSNLFFSKPLTLTFKVDLSWVRDFVEILNVGKFVFLFLVADLEVVVDETIFFSDFATVLNGALRRFDFFSGGQETLDEFKILSKNLFASLSESERADFLLISIQFMMEFACALVLRREADFTVDRSVQSLHDINLVYQRR